MSKWSVNAKVFIALVTVALGTIVFGLFQSPSAAEFRLHRARYEQIVAKVKTMGIEPGSYDRKNHLWTAANLDAATLGLKQTNKDDMVGMIEVFRDDSGAYSVSITTLDRGHFGTFGYVYSEIPNEYPLHINQYLTEQRQIDPHWWIAENNSW